MSDYLLESNGEHDRDNRMAALCFDDEVKLSLRANRGQLTALRVAGFTLEVSDEGSDGADDVVGALLTSLDADNDARLNASSLQAALHALGLRTQAVADLNVTVADCALLKLGPSECGRLSNAAARLRSQIDVDNDGDIDARVTLCPRPT